MAKRYVSIWFPHLLTDWLVIRRPGLKDTSFVFTAPVHGRIIITSASLEAKRLGVTGKMALADARAIVPDLEVFEDKPGRIEKLLNGLGEWCIRFSPVVAIDLPGGLIIDSSGCSYLWGGEKEYLETILNKLRTAGYHCRGAMADTVGCAWAFARYGEQISIIPEGGQNTELLSLPPMALRIDTRIVERLHKLGLKKIGSFIQMPRSVLRRRFGEELLVKLGQALGTEEEVIKPLVIIPPYQERLPCLEAIRTATGIEIAIHKLLETLCYRLKTEGLGLRAAQMKGYRVDGKIVQAEIGTNSSTSHVEHLFKLFALKIPGLEPALGIELFTMEATKTEPVALFQEKLWSGSPGLEDRGLAELLDRLAGKIGAGAIHRYLPQAHYWPERSIRTALSLQEKPEQAWRINRPRPVQLLNRPEAVDVTAPIPDYPPMNFRYKGQLHAVSKADGPERIEREWWMDKGEHRDYYIIEDDKGQRYWIFRSGHYNETGTQWFIHGFFA
jgi:protein ImuB